MANLDNYGYLNDSYGKLSWLLDAHYNLFHADMICRAIHDESISIEDFIHGVTMINTAERNDEDEFTPEEFKNV